MGSKKRGAGGRSSRPGGEAGGKSRPASPSPDFRRRWFDWLTTSGPGVIIIVGMTLMAINDPWAPHVVGVGVAIQVAFLVWRLFSLRGGGKVKPEGQAKRSREG